MIRGGVLLRRALAAAEAVLRAADVDSPRLSAQLMAACSLGVERQDLLLRLDNPLTAEESARLEALTARRAGGEPAAYILGTREFYGLDFAVSPSVLIPRPETELVVEEALRLFPPDSPVRFADLGTGSGALAVTLAALRPAWRGLALDRSADALAVARANAAAHGVLPRLLTVRADFAALPAPLSGFDLVVSNPPYVSEAEWEGLSREVASFEPRCALVAGATGLEAAAVLTPAAAKALRPGGVLLMEIGAGQGEAAQALLRDQGAWRRVQVLPDLAGRDRVAAAER